MKEIIKFAESRGYTGHLKYLPLILPRVHLDPYFLLNGHESDIFFDHDFVVAVFGEDEWYIHIKELAMEIPEHRKQYIHEYIRGQTHDEVDEKRKDS